MARFRPKPLFQIPASRADKAPTQSEPHPENRKEVLWWHLRSLENGNAIVRDTLPRVKRARLYSIATGGGVVFETVFEKGTVHALAELI